MDTIEIFFCISFLKRFYNKIVSVKNLVLYNLLNGNNPNKIEMKGESMEGEKRQRTKERKKQERRENPLRVIRERDNCKGEQKREIIKFFSKN